MEDRYLFKAQRSDNGEWVEWNALTGIPHDISIRQDTICQCTGLKDKNGNLIWENDIANCLTEECCGYIGWNESEAGFYFNVLFEDGKFEEEHIYDYQDGIEVVGNIFDNSELLESEVGKDDGDWTSCTSARKQWAEQEYTEPPIDWSKVEVDTPIHGVLTKTT